MSFAQPGHSQRRLTLSLAPMLDVLFLLLIFFVTTSTFRAEEQIDVDLPAAEASAPADPQGTEVVINVRDDGAIQIGSAAYEPEQLRSMLGQLVADFPDERVVIRGDQRVNYGRIVTVMDTARSAGVRDIYFATVREADEIGN